MSLNQRISPSLSEKVSSQQVPVLEQAGFTLLEMMIVLAIFGVLTSIAVGSWSSNQQAAQVQSAGAKLYSALTSARIKALTTSKNQYVGVDVYANRFATTLDASSVYNGSSWAVDTNWVDVDGADFLHSKADGSAPVSEVITVETIRFKPAGGATGTSILIKPSNGANGFKQVLVVSGFTGRIRKAECTMPSMNCR